MTNPQGWEGVEQFSGVPDASVLLMMVRRSDGKIIFGDPAADIVHLRSRETVLAGSGFNVGLERFIKLVRYYEDGPDIELLYEIVDAEPLIDPTRFQINSDGATKWAKQVLGREVSIRQFGYRFVETDQRVVVQRAIDYLTQIYDPTLNYGSDVACIAGTVWAKPAANLPSSSLPLSFKPNRRIRMKAEGQGGLKAIAAMPKMIGYTYNTGVTNGSTPFFAEFEKVTLDGNELADTGLDLDWGFHARVKDNVIFRTKDCIVARGRGAHQIEGSHLSGERCIVFGVGGGQDPGTDFGGGDSSFSKNDCYPKKIAFDMGLWSGNTVIDKNTGTRHDDAVGSSDPVYLVRLSGDYSSDGLRQVNDIRVCNNEGRGFDALVYGRRSSASRNIYSIGIDENHTNGYFTHNAGVVADLVGADDVKFGVNWANYERASPATGAEAYKLVDCRRPTWTEASALRHYGRLATLTDCIDPVIKVGGVLDVGMIGASECAILINGTTVGAVVEVDKARQSWAGYAQTFVREEDSANGTIVRGLAGLVGFTKPAELIGATSVSDAVLTGLVATGSTQGTALALHSRVSVAATVASGTGVILPATPGKYVVVNAGANALLVYPAVGASINALSANQPFSVSAGALARFEVVSATKAYT